MTTTKSAKIDSDKMAEDEEEEQEEISEDDTDYIDDASKSSLYEESIKMKFESSMVYTPLVTLKPCVTRRTVAEDMKYNLIYVKSLHTTILDHMAKSFGEYPVDFNLLPPNDAQYVVDHINLKLPLDVATKTIPYESYWEKKCKTQIGKWYVGKKVKDFGGSYRRMFFEWYLSNDLVEFIPFVSDQKQLIKNFEIGGEFVKTLDLDEMLIAVKGRTTEVPKETSENFSKSTYGHVDLGILGPYLSGLETLRLKYRVAKCGLNFDWAMYYCTTSDMKNLCRLTSYTPNLTELTINQSRLDDVKVKILMWCLVPLESLKILDLSHNCLKNDSARFIAKLLLKNLPLELLNLSDNNIYSDGAMALFFSLQHNRHLRHLNLNLNFVDFKATYILNSMACVNDTLETLVLSANHITDEFCEILADKMPQFTCITTLDLSSNIDISDTGLKMLLKGWEGNIKLREIKLKGTHLQDDVLDCLKQMLYTKNRKNIL